MKIREKIRQLEGKIVQLNYKIDILFAKGLKVDHQLKINEREELKIILKFLRENKEDLECRNFQ